MANGAPWSIFQQGGGQGAAATWADDALREIGAPLSLGNEQVVYDWEVSEGGGGQFNPLNQGPDPSNPSLSGGSQYGGGAADYTSWKAGLTGTKDYLSMPSYAGIRNDLRQNDPTQARTDIINSPWAASHYDYGAAFSSAPVPGHKSALKGGGPIQAQTTSFTSSISGVGTALTDITSADFWERAGLIIFGVIFVIVGIIILALPGAARLTGEAAKVGRSATSIGNTIGAIGGSGGPTEEEKADRQRRLTLAEQNTQIGAEKVRIQGMREARLAGSGASRKKHKTGSEPNPNPAHS